MNALVADLLQQTLLACARRSRRRIALLGLSAEALELQDLLHLRGWHARLVGIFDPDVPAGAHVDLVKPWSDFANEQLDLVVVCDDAGKERLLRACDRELGPTNQLPDVVIAGMAHFNFRGAVFDELDRPAMVPSYATGTANTRIHLFQCLEAAAAANLTGAVIELGAFKGGTTAWLARVTKRLGLSSRVIGFDSWSGFPPRRSVLDLYTHPRCVFTDLDSVRKYVEPLGVELVVGDIAETAPRVLRDVEVLLAFVDTDNYSGSSAALRAIVPNLVHGGSVVFDHFWTTSDYLYTIGERMAGQEVLSAAGLLQLHGTGVFVKL